MSTIKNIRPGILVIPDAKLRLRPGQTAEVGQPTNQIERLIASGHLVRVGGGEVAGGAAKVEEAVEVASIARAGPVGQTAPVTQAAPPSPSTTSTQSTPSISPTPTSASTPTAPAAPSDKAPSESDRQRSVLEALTKKRQEVGGGAE